MKIHSDTPDAVISNVETQGEFRIKNSAKAFSILSSGLYSNKIKAIVRELSCNALDSHKEAGNLETPFTVHLPNSFEPYFSVTDYGIGLDHEGVTQLYTTYFESTKQDSNDYIGALGLGSKSPFSYTDNFSVIAKKHGMVRIYTAYIADTGCPAIALMSQAVMLDKSPQNGVEVKFGVTDNYDIRMFVNEAHSVFKWFKQKPDVVGNSSYYHQEPSFADKDISPGVHLLDSGRQCYALQGNIAYPINLPKSDEYKHLEHLLDCPLLLEFNIGELDIAASREELSYIPWTISNIVKKLNVVAGDIGKYLEKEVSEIENEWDLAFKLRSLYNTSSLFKAGVSSMIRNGRCSLLKMGNYGIEENTKVLGLPPKELEGRGISLKALEVDNSWSGTVVREVRMKRDYDQRDKPHYHEIPLGNENVFIVNDTKKGPIARVRYHYKEEHGSRTRNKRIFLLDVKDKENEEEILAKFYKRLKHPPAEYLKVSDLTEKDKLKAVKASLLELVRKEKYTSYQYNKYWGWDKVSDFEAESSETYYYVPVSNYTVMSKDGKDVVYNFLDKIWPNVRQAGLCKDIHVYGVRKSYIKTIEAEPNWVCIYDLIDEEVGKINAQQILGHIAHQTIDSNYIEYHMKSVVPDLADDSAFKEFFVSVQDAISLSNSNDVLEATLYLIRHFNIDLGVDMNKERERINTEQDRMMEIYPMLSFIKEACGINDESDASTFKDYITLVDNTRRESND